MIHSKHKFIELIYTSVDSINRMLPSNSKLMKTPETVLVGDGGVLDSLDLLNLLVEIEVIIRKELGIECSLINDELLADIKGPLNTIDSLAEWLAKNFIKR